MFSPKIAEALLFETQKAVPLPMAGLILGAVSQADALTELVDRVCDPVLRNRVKTTDSRQLP